MYLRPRALMFLHAHRHVYSQYERREKEEERRECAGELVRKGVEISTSYTLRGQVWHRSRVIAGNRIDAEYLVFTDVTAPRVYVYRVVARVCARVSGCSGSG